MAAVSTPLPSGMVSDEQLIRRFTQGDPSGLNELFLRYRSVAYQVAFRLLGNEADALDAVQDGFVNAFTHLEHIRGFSSFRSWLLKIVSNAALDLYRQRSRRSAHFGNSWRYDDLDVLGSDWSFDDSLGREELRGVLDRALETLPLAQRQTFVLHADGGMTYREIADVLDISIGTVMSRIFYARQRLRSILTDQVFP